MQIVQLVNLNQIMSLFQELIAALLACALLCLFPASTRGENYLPTINFDYLFAYVVLNDI